MTRPKVLGSMHGNRPVDGNTRSDAVRSFVQLAPVRSNEKPGGAEQAADIRGRARATDFPVRGRDVHDAALALPQHCANLVLHAEKHTKHIGVEDSSIVLGVCICSGLGITHGTGVIDGNVQTAETSDGLVDEVFDFLFMPHVGAQKFGFRAEFAQLGGKLLAFVVVASGNNHPRPFSGEGLGRGPPDAGQGSGNQDNR